MALPISIAMTTFNGARFVAEQLRSFTGQTLWPHEVVVIDDGSTDGTRDIVKAFAASAPFPVRLTTYENYLGYKAKFQIAAGLCQAQLIAFADQDDVWLPGKLAACAERFADRDVLLTYHNATVTNAALEPAGSMAYQAAPRALNPPGSLEPWLYGNGFTLVFRRELLAFADLWPRSVDAHFPEEREAQDQWFFFLASSLGTIAYIREPLALYRQHGANLFGWNKQSRGPIGAVLDQIDRLRKANARSLAARATAAGSRAAILEEMQKQLSDPGRRQRASEAAHGWRRLEQNYRLRCEIYGGGNAFARLRRLAELIRQGTYRPQQQWGAGRKGMVRDFVRGVAVPARDNPSAGKS